MNEYLEWARRCFAEIKSGKVDIHNRSLGLILAEFNSSKYLSGASFADLDPTRPAGKEVTEAEFHEAVKNCYLIQARQAFDYLRSGAEDIRVDDELGGIGVVSAIRSSLEKSEKGYAALDPSGKFSEEAMRRSVDEAAERARIICARGAFQKLMEGKGDVDTLLNTIHKVDVVKLDPSGKQAKSQLEAVLSEAEKQGYIRQARELLEDIPSGRSRYFDAYTIFSSPEVAVEELRDNLKKAGVTPAALDPQGRRSEAEMEAVIVERCQQCHINNARDRYKTLQENTCNSALRPNLGIAYAIDDIRDELQLAGVTLAALDPSGERSATEIEQDLLSTRKSAYIKNAQAYYKELLSGSGSSSGYQLLGVQSICDALKEAGVDASALDETGTQSVGEIEKTLIMLAANIGQEPCIPARVSRGNGR